MLSHNAVLVKRANVTLETVVRRILKSFDAATVSDLESGARWYDEAGELAATLGATSGHGRSHAAAVLSHLSPRTSWTRNVHGAVSLLTYGDADGSGCMGANIDRARASLGVDEADLESTFGGPKTLRFFRNILGDRDAVTVDVWAARVGGITEQELSRVGVYDAVEHAYRLAAGRRGVDPATMQATTWVVARGGRAA